MPLRLRLAVLFALAVAVVIAGAGLAFVLQMRVSVEASLDPGLRARVASVADELGSEDTLVLPATGDTIVQVSRPDGRMIAATGTGTSPLLDPAQRRHAVAAGETSFTTAVNGDRSRVLAEAVPTGAGSVVVAVATGTDVADAAVERAESALFVGGPPAVLLAGLGAWLLAGAVLRPVERMRRQTAAISDDDLGRRLAVPSTRDEIAALGATMNALLARLEQALQRERGFVADAGHELRTPLAILRTELELAARPGRSREALVEAVDLAGQETDRLIRLAEGLLLLARADNNQPFVRPTRLSLSGLVGAAVRGAGARAVDRAITVAVHGPAEMIVDADPDRLRQAVDNLLDNAVRHAPDGSTVDVNLATRGPGVVGVEVADRGPGFPADFIEHAFERFNRAGAARSRDSGGAGLGLSIVRAIAQAHGGRAVAANRADGGATVTIELPTSTAAEDAPSPPPDRARATPVDPAADSPPGYTGSR